MKTGLWHNFVTGTLVVLAVLSIVATTFLVWFQQTALNTNNFVSVVVTSTEDPRVISSISLRLSDQIITALDVENKLRELLPDRLDALAAPVAQALETGMADAVTNVLANPDVQQVWRGLLTTTHSGLIAFLRGDTANAQIVDGTLTLDVIGMAQVALERLQADGLLPDVQIPDTASTPQRQQILERLNAALNTRLPDDFGIVKIANAQRLQTASMLVQGIDVVAIAMVVISVVLSLLAIRWANRNYRALMWIVGGVVALVGLLMIGLSALGVRGGEAVEAPDGHALIGAFVVNLSNSFTDWLAIVVTVAVAVGVVATIWHFLFGRSNETAAA